VSQNAPPLACYNFDMCERILTFFGRNVTDKVGNQTTLYYTTSNNVCFYTPWQNGETWKSHFSRKCCISAVPEFNQLLDFFNLSDWRLILMLLHDFLNLAINMFSSGLLGGMAEEKQSRERCRSWTVLPAQCTIALSSGFPVSQGNAQALDRWGGKRKTTNVKYRRLAYG